MGRRVGEAAAKESKGTFCLAEVLFEIKIFQAKIGDLMQFIIHKILMYQRPSEDEVRIYAVCSDFQPEPSSMRPWKSVKLRPGQRRTINFLSNNAKSLHQHINEKRPFPMPSLDLDVAVGGKILLFLRFARIILFSHRQISDSMIIDGAKE